MPFQLDTGKKGLEMFFKKWQVESLRFLWNIYPEGANSRVVHENVNKNLKGSISRASVINFLNRMVDEALLTYTETTGKGGHHRVYHMKYGETEFQERMATLIISKLLKEYPEETRKALQDPAALI